MTPTSREHDPPASRTLVDRAFGDPESLAESLAEHVATHLAAGIARAGRATLVLSGGSTPRRFMRRLSERAIDWSRVRVTLADERWVPPDSERSNERLVRENLLLGPASKAAFEPLYVDAGTADETRNRVAPRIATLPRPFDVVVLGMGDDGHTASLFPNGDRLRDALDPHGAETILAMRAPAAPESRLTMTLPALIDTRYLALHIEGETKRAVLAAALGEDGSDAHYPIRAVLRHARTPVELFWCA